MKASSTRSSCRCIAALLLCTMLLIGLTSHVRAVTIETVPVGNIRNRDDIHGDGYGGVDHRYRIGKTEVTNAQYVEFLNAVAKLDKFGLYNTLMGDENMWGAIDRKDSPEGYVYSIKSPAAGKGLGGGGNYMYDNKPVVHVHWYDALRFANWLHNGQPTGVQDASTTEDGAYSFEFNSLTGVGPRNLGAEVVSPK